MRGIERISTVGMSREEWLERRRKTIGGSDAAAIVGLSKYSSPFSVWCDKTGRVPDKPDNEAMRQGRDLEQYVADRFMEASGKRVQRVNAMLYNSDYPFAHADVDRWVVGENAGLECKTTSTLDVKQFRGVDFPEKYYAQCVHYMAVTGAERWYLAVLIFGREFHVYTLERDEAEIEALMSAERSFWTMVETDTPPGVDGADATTEALKTIYADSAPETCSLFGRESILDEYMALKRQIKAIDERIANIQNVICEDMKDAERGEIGAYTVSWKTQERSTFQRKDFEKAHPEIDMEPFYKKSKSRPFKVTEAKNEE